MNVRQFINHVKKMAEDNDIHFFMMADGITAYRGSIQEISAVDTHIGKQEAPMQTKWNWYDLFNVILNIKQENPENPVPLFVGSADLKNYPEEMTEYHMRIATHQREFVIWSGNIDEPAEPIITATLTNNGDILISVMRRVMIDEDGAEVEKIGSVRTERISNMTGINGSIPSLVPMYVANEIERFLNELLFVTNS